MNSLYFYELPGFLKITICALKFVLQNSILPLSFSGDCPAKRGARLIAYIGHETHSFFVTFIRISSRTLL